MCAGSADESSSGYFRLPIPRRGLWLSTLAISDPTSLASESM